MTILLNDNFRFYETFQFYLISILSLFWHMSRCVLYRNSGWLQLDVVSTTWKIAYCVLVLTGQQGEKDKNQTLVRRLCN